MDLHHDHRPYPVRHWERVPASGPSDSRLIINLTGRTPRAQMAKNRFRYRSASSWSPRTVPEFIRL